MTGSELQTSQNSQSLGTRDGSGAMFDDIAGRYDLLNRIISLGLDQSWRRKTVAALEMGENERVLDLATGTADLALRVASLTDSVQVLGLDPSAKMLTVAAHKVAASGHVDRVRLLRGDAESLPFADDSIDRLCMAFGIRNVPDRARALREMARVTRRGGRIAILELAEPQRGVMASLARMHVHHIVPWLGGLLSGSREYRYLQRSIAAFPSPSDFCRVIESSGLSLVACQPLTFGVATLYVATPNKAASGSVLGAGES